MTAQEIEEENTLILELLSKHDAFHKQTAQEYPELTDYDLRLCVLLKANLSTKEMARILDIAPDSLKKAKYRLRKKINSNPESSILQTI